MQEGGDDDVEAVLVDVFVNDGLGDVWVKAKVGDIMGVDAGETLMFGVKAGVVDLGVHAVMRDVGVKAGVIDVVITVGGTVMCG